jgi:hypothetical protein
LTVTGKKLIEDTSPLIFDLMRQYQRVFSEADYTNFFQAVQLYERQVRELTEVNQSGLD